MTNEQIETIIENQNKLKTKKLQTRQHALKTWLEEHQQGKYWTIEEIVYAVRDSDGNPYYKLNKSPYTHDKCVVLSSDVRELNWQTGRERYIPIIKDSRGSIKLAESKEELEEYINKEKAKIKTKYEYYNHLTSLIDLEGTMPFVNQANRVLDEDEIKPIEVYAK
jgi:hypothetical protein